MDVADGPSKPHSAFGVILENDVNLAVLGENWLGQGQGIDNLAYVALGTGIGSGLIVGGQLVRGARNAAGEISFLPIGGDPFAAESLRAGAYESVVATHGMGAARYQIAKGERTSVPVIFERGGSGRAGGGFGHRRDRALSCLWHRRNIRHRRSGKGGPGRVYRHASRNVGTRKGRFLFILRSVPRVESRSQSALARVLRSSALPQSALANYSNTCSGVDTPASRISLPPANLATIGGGCIMRRRNQRPCRTSWQPCSTRTQSPGAVSRRRLAARASPATKQTSFPTSKSR